MKWRIVIEGEGSTPPSIKPWLRSVNEGGPQLTLAEVCVGEDPPDESDVVTDLLVDLENGD